MLQPEAPEAVRMWHEWVFDTGNAEYRLYKCRVCGKILTVPVGWVVKLSVGEIFAELDRQMEDGGVVCVG